MRNVLLTLIISLAVLSASAQDQHIGTWQNNDNGDIGYVKFNAEGYAWFIINNTPQGGPSFTLDGEQCKMTYTVNYDAVPHTVDFIITSLESGQVVEKQLGIFAFKTDYQTMYLCLDLYRRNRPTTFEEDYTMVLARLWQ